MTIRSIDGKNTSTDHVLLPLSCLIIQCRWSTASNLSWHIWRQLTEIVSVMHVDATHRCSYLCVLYSTLLLPYHLLVRLVRNCLKYNLQMSYSQNYAVPDHHIVKAQAAHGTAKQTQRAQQDASHLDREVSSAYSIYGTADKTALLQDSFYTLPSRDASHVCAKVRSLPLWGKVWWLAKVSEWSYWHVVRHEVCALQHGVHCWHQAQNLVFLAVYAEACACTQYDRTA